MNSNLNWATLPESVNPTKRKVTWYNGVPTRQHAHSLECDWSSWRCFCWHMWSPICAGSNWWCHQEQQEWVHTSMLDNATSGNIHLSLHTFISTVIYNLQQIKMINKPWTHNRMLYTSVVYYRRFIFIANERKSSVNAARFSKWTQMV